MYCWWIPYGQVITDVGLFRLFLQNQIISSEFKSNLFFTFRVFGIRLGTCIFALLVVVGVTIVALGAILNKFWLMVAGRFIFGYVFNRIM